MRMLIALLALASALASCQADPVSDNASAGQAGSEATVTVVPGACSLTEVPLSHNGSEAVIIAGAGNSAPIIILAHADSWPSPVTLSVRSDAGEQACSSAMSGDTTVDCGRIAFGRSGKVTVSAHADPDLPPGFTITVAVY